MPSELAHGTLEDAKAAADVSMRSLIRPVLRGALALTLALGGCAWDGPMSTVMLSGATSRTKSLMAVSFEPSAPT